MFKYQKKKQVIDNVNSALVFKWESHLEWQKSFLMLGEPWTFSAPRHSQGPQTLLYICNKVGWHKTEPHDTQHTR